MGCIRAKVTMEPTILASTAILNSSMKTKAHRLEELNILTTYLNPKLSMKCGIVCSIDDVHKYIKVDEGPIWLLKVNDYSSDVVVYSNTEWRIEINK